MEWLVQAPAVVQMAVVLLTLVPVLIALAWVLMWAVDKVAAHRRKMDHHAQ
ncbi:hypothetical protein G7Y31_08695 [Corynebacterium lizhenjunii]|uniref:Uncharacterized protein n=1 Tax=Corynebacterium lizhenjunii TaxID=2709394 RepID=A0A7T0PD73_9CORY|nr:hypothetical protein [Corynebacterium lizhenjunii]QPK80447.1 hypothetical protein G7Y31_08695 [Corynebacterium lizhenjunii]